MTQHRASDSLGLPNDEPLACHSIMMPPLAVTQNFSLSVPKNKPGRRNFGRMRPRLQPAFREARASHCVHNWATNIDQEHQLPQALRLPGGTATLGRVMFSYVAGAPLARGSYDGTSMRARVRKRARRRLRAARPPPGGHCRRSPHNPDSEWARRLGMPTECMSSGSASGASHAARWRGYSACPDSRRSPAFSSRLALPP